MMKPRQKPPIDLFPSEEEVVELAMERCFSGHEMGDDRLSYLQAAEDELLDRAAKRALLAIKPRPPR